MRNKESTQETALWRHKDSALTEDIQKIARDQLNETPETKEKCLQELRILIRGEKDLLVDESDNFLLQFLRARKYRTHSAFTQIKKFYRHRLVYPKLYQGYSPKQNLPALQTNLLNFLPHRTPEGCAVLVARIGLWNPEELDCSQLLRCGLLLTEKALQNPVTQIAGLISVVDLQGLSWTHMTHLPPTTIKCFVQAIQDSFPIRHREIHVINNPSIFGYLFTCVRPILTDVIKKRIHFHGYDLDSLHRYLPPSILPEEYGGSQGPFENDEFYKSLMESEREFQDSQKYGYQMKS